ncbi:zinc finger protein 69 homolog [Pecten maximus]|uniref:zinc finger protein 69 homolog n=1 Tax=Pecten maximus TaxID=6579 RepID=UPI0014589305|nr:zinc finger protein 69 homolog [Pecten maximus]
MVPNGNVTVYQFFQMESQALDVEHEEVVDEGFVCAQCGKRMKHASSLRRHNESHSSATYSCSSCGKTFKSNYLLKQHHKRKHETTDQRICFNCGKTFSSLSNHLRNKHSEKKRFPYILCNKHFNDKYALTKHMKKHDGPTEKCPKCLKEFKHLENHMKSCRRKKSSIL